MVPLILTVVTASPPPVLTDTSGAWLVDGAPLAQSCEQLRTAREVIVETRASHPWSRVEPALAEARQCGVKRLELRAGNIEPVMLSLTQSDDPVLLVGNDTYVVHGGVAAKVELKEQAATVWRAFPTMTRPCLAVAQTTRAGAIATQGASLLGGAGRRPARVCLLLEGDVAALPEPTRRVVELLRGGDAGDSTAATPPTGHLTRWLGQSVAPVAEEREVPRWTRASSLICSTGGAREMWGIGTVTGIRNHALARVTADNRARAEIAKLVQVHISRSGGATKTFTAQTLSGVQIVDHFISGKTTWALATLDTDRPASQPCPSGSETVREWSWRTIDPDGGFGTDRPEWTRADIGNDDSHVWVTVSTTTRRPLAEATALLETLARGGLTAVFARGALAIPAHTTETGADCLSSVPWLQVAAAAPVETWYDVDSAGLYARVTLDLAELRGALGTGCDTGLIDRVITMARRGTTIEPTASVPAVVEYPEWVLQGTVAASQESGRVFYGVGSVSGIKNHALARTTADNRARAEIAKMFEVFSAVLMRDYMRTLPSGDEEQHVAMAIRTFSAQTLSGIQVVDHWFHPDGTVYALAQLDLDVFETRIGKMRELNRQVRDYVRQNAERVHRSLEQER